MTHHAILSWQDRTNDAVDKLLELFPVGPTPDRVFFLLGHVNPRHDVFYSGPPGEQWTAIQELIAWHISGTCRPEDISIRDVYYGGEDGDENYVELICRDGIVVGSFDRPLSIIEAATL